MTDIVASPNKTEVVPVEVQQNSSQTPQAPNESMKSEMEYAGFGIRFGAYFIDGIIFTIISFIIYLPISIFFGLTSAAVADSSAASLGVNIISFVVNLIIGLAIGFFYNAFAESSPWQGTIGKKILNLRVVDEEGKRITLGKASIRFFVKWAQTILLVSRILYLTAAFTEKKQNLHDMVAGTYVIK